MYDRMNYSCPSKSGRAVTANIGGEGGLMARKLNNEMDAQSTAKKTKKPEGAVNK